jgi:hypothetical protein
MITINLNEIAKTVSKRMYAMVDTNVEDYAEDFNEDQLVEQAFEYVVEGTDFDWKDYDKVLSLVESHREVRMALVLAKEQVEGFKEEWQAMMGEYGDGSMYSKMRALGVSYSD